MSIQFCIHDQTADILNDYLVRDVELRIHGADPAMTDASQFDESDYNYLHRRWENLGWHYWYEHRADGHTLILSDDTTQAAPVEGDSPEIEFQREAGSNEQDAIGEWVPTRRIVPAKVTLTSFDFKKPKPRAADTPTNNRQGDVLQLEVYEYAGAYGFKNIADGKVQSVRRMEEIEGGGKHFKAAGNGRMMQTRRWIRLVGHFDNLDFGNDDQAREFLILAVRHQVTNNYQMHGAQPSHYQNDFLCIRKIIPWRPGRNLNSVEPKIHGVQTALVVGPPGEEIHTDEYGRVRVQFHWDRIGQFNEKSSAWVRVATAWAGPNFGATSIPRIGTEVIIVFLDGNPDRPLITGMVPNADTVPPWTLPANKTQSGILTRSTPGGVYSNANAIRFEDMKGKEQLWLHAEKDQLTEVEHDEDKWVGHDRRKTIDRDETNHIKRDRAETVDHDEKITVHNNRTERVDHHENVSIGDNRSVTVGGHKSETVAMTKTETIGLAKMLTIGAVYQTSVGAAMNTTVGLGQAEEVGLSKTVVVGNTFSITAGDEFSITVGKATLVMKSDGTIVINGTQFNFEASGPVQISGKDVDIN